MAAYHKKSKRRKKKISPGLKDNLTVIIDELSVITGRKGWPKEDSRRIITDSYNNADVHIAAIALILPDVDLEWRESGAREAFLKLKKQRQWLIRSLFGAAIFGAILLISAAVVSIILISTFVKWIILGAAILILFLSLSYVVPYLISPYITRRDQTLPERKEDECQLIDNYVKFLIDFRRK